MPRRETALFKRYEAYLRGMAELDLDYYLKSEPTRAERANYELRKRLLQEFRARLHTELRGTRGEESPAHPPDCGS